MPFIRRRGLTAAAAVIAAIMVTTTACSKTEEGGAKASDSTTAQADAGDNIDTGENESGGDTTIGGFKLPEGVPTDLSGDALRKWKDGGWQDFSGDWASKAEDFANPYIENFWTPERIAEAEENLPDLPAVAEAGNTATGSGKTTQVWLPDGKVKKQKAAKVKATYHKNAPRSASSSSPRPRGRASARPRS